MGIMKHVKENKIKIFQNEFHNYLENRSRSPHKLLKEIMTFAKKRITRVNGYLSSSELLGHSNELWEFLYSEFMPNSYLIARKEIKGLSKSSRCIDGIWYEIFKKHWQLSGFDKVIDHIELDDYDSYYIHGYIDSYIDMLYHLNHGNMHRVLQLDNYKKLLLTPEMFSHLRKPISAEVADFILKEIKELYHPDFAFNQTSPNKYRLFNDSTPLHDTGSTSSTQPISDDRSKLFCIKEGDKLREISLIEAAFKLGASVEFIDNLELQTNALATSKKTITTIRDLLENNNEQSEVIQHKLMEIFAYAVRYNHVAFLQTHSDDKFSNVDVRTNPGFPLSNVMMMEQESIEDKQNMITISENTIPLNENAVTFNDQFLSEIISQRKLRRITIESELTIQGSNNLSDLTGCSSVEFSENDSNENISIFERLAKIHYYNDRKRLLESGTLEFADYLKKFKFNPRWYDMDGNTYLHHFAKMRLANSAEVFEWLLAAGADIRFRNNKNETVLHVAITYLNEDLINSVLSHKNENSFSSNEMGENSSLSHMATAAKDKKLVEFVKVPYLVLPHITQPNEKAATGLLFSILKCNVPFFYSRLPIELITIAEKLLDLGAQLRDTRSLAIWFEMILAFVNDSDSLQILTSLLVIFVKNGLPIWHITNKDSSAMNRGILFLAVRTGSMELMLTLLNNAPQSMENNLDIIDIDTYPIRYQHRSVSPLQYILHKYSISSQNNDSVLAKKQMALIELFCQREKAFNAKDCSGLGVLTEAISLNLVEVVPLLLAHGACLWQVGGCDNLTPLLWAVSEQKSEIVSLLLKHISTLIAKADTNEQKQEIKSRALHEFEGPISKLIPYTLTTCKNNKTPESLEILKLVLNNKDLVPELSYIDKCKMLLDDEDLTEESLVEHIEKLLRQPLSSDYKEKKLTIALQLLSQADVEKLSSDVLDHALQTIQSANFTKIHSDLVKEITTISSKITTKEQTRLYFRCN